jgi:hypothetical protein
MPSREASLRNLEKAQAKWRRPLPWRSAQESRVIKRLAWQWFTYSGPGKWSGRAVSRWLGVTHTYIQKLVREFAADPGKIQREMHRNSPATFEHLNRAREETRQEKECGWLRQPQQMKRASFTIGDQVVSCGMRTKAKERRQAAEVSAHTLSPMNFAFHELPVWARGLPYYSLQNPCDPLICVEYAIQPSRQRRPVRFARRWRPGRPFRW